MLSADHLPGYLVNKLAFTSKGTTFSAEHQSEVCRVVSSLDEVGKHTTETFLLGEQQIEM
jgi:hypothetical protein